MHRDDRWQHLVQASFELHESVGVEAGTDGVAGARRLLDSVLEVFPSSLDPLEDFEGYAVRRLALALREAIGP